MDDIDPMPSPALDHSESRDLGNMAARIPSPILDEPEKEEASTAAPGGTQPAPLHSTVSNNSSISNQHHLRRRLERAGATISRPHLPHRQQQYSSYAPLGWTEEGYHDENPWYGQDPQRPIFSLGKPLPHTLRRHKFHSTKRSGAPHDIERGYGEDGAAHGGLPSRSISRVDSRGPAYIQSADGVNARDVQRMQELSTAAGVGHGHKYNEAGQPVFEYLPEEHTAPSNTQRTHRQTTTTTATGQWPNAQAENDQLDDSPSNDETPGKAETRNPDELRNLWARVRARHPEPLAEFLATGMALFLGLASTLSVNLSANQPTSYGNFETSCWAWGFAWMFGIYLGGGVSGAHMNPAISICLSLFRGFPWSQCGIYLAVHFLATLSAAALAYGIYADSIHHLDPSLDSMSQTFFSTPQEWVSFPSAFLSQMVGSAVMMIAVFALGDDQNNPPGAGMHAFVLGLLVTTLKFALGFNGAAALNPASDFGPRVIAYAVGYRDPKVFATGWWLYGPWLGTLAGSMLGCIIYDGCIFVGSESPVNYRMSPTFKSIGKRVTKWRKSVRN